MYYQNNMTMQCRSKYKSFDLILKFECCHESSALSVNDKTCPVILLTTELTSLKKGPVYEEI